MTDEEEREEGDTEASTLGDANALRAELDEIKAEIALLKGREVKIKA